MIKLKKISILPTAKLFCAFHFTVGIILGLIAAIGSMSGQAEDGFWSLGWWSVLVFPLVNGVLGFLTGLLLASGYNSFSRVFGALEFETQEFRNKTFPIDDKQA